MREPEIAAGLSLDAKTLVSGEGFIDDMLVLVARLRAAMRERGTAWRAVVGIARGGVFPARLVAEALGLEYREIHVSYYRGTIKGAEPATLRAPADKGSGDGLLVVDDVIDSGGTALCVRRLWPRCDLAAVYTKPAGLRALLAAGAVPFCGREMDDRWIVFPWDQPGWDELSPQLITMFRERLRG
ncbi:MAG TPA: phosphoribosyltransferase family protein [Stellaceae bacterium]|nr:phosphoribosyltransferase family protein [Stellaceae bacterium]